MELGAKCVLASVGDWGDLSVRGQGRCQKQSVACSWVAHSCSWSKQHPWAELWDRAAPSSAETQVGAGTAALRRGKRWVTVMGGSFRGLGSHEFILACFISTREKKNILGCVGLEQWVRGSWSSRCPACPVCWNCTRSPSDSTEQCCGGWRSPACPLPFLVS